SGRRAGACPGQVHGVGTADDGRRLYQRVESPRGAEGQDRELVGCTQRISTRDVPCHRARVTAAGVDSGQEDGGVQPPQPLIDDTHLLGRGHDRAQVIGRVTFGKVKLPSEPVVALAAPTMTVAPATGSESPPMTLPATVMGTGGVIWIVAPALSPVPALAVSVAVV